MTKKILRVDPKYISIPNICFSLTEDSDRREDKYKLQRLKRGFDDSETWCLTSTIAAFILPRLKRFKTLENGYPSTGDETESSWNKKLNKMIKAFELIVRDRSSWLFSDKEQKTVDEGLDLFRKYFFNLWW